MVELEIVGLRDRGRVVKLKHSMIRGICVSERLFSQQRRDECSDGEEVVTGSLIKGC